ncbi:MAG: hypothetical protein SFV19_16830 [Rhodospirillaceae bacterium]|nr:hypothetical protein [Rhodospirillaceae bacterium]
MRADAGRERPVADGLESMQKFFGATFSAAIARQSSVKFAACVLYK